jgi:hypothetical protein
MLLHPVLIGFRKRNMSMQLRFGLSGINGVTPGKTSSKGLFEGRLVHGNRCLAVRVFEICRDVAWEGSF